MKGLRSLHSKHILIVISTSLLIVGIFILYKLTVSSIYQSEKTKQFNADIFNYLKEHKDNTAAEDKPEIPINVPEASNTKSNSSHYIWIIIITINVILGCIVGWFFINPTVKEGLYEKLNTMFSGLKNSMKFSTRRSTRSVGVGETSFDQHDPSFDETETMS